MQMQIASERRKKRQKNKTSIFNSKLIEMEQSDQKDDNRQRNVKTHSK